MNKAGELAKKPSNREFGWLGQRLPRIAASKLVATAPELKLASALELRQVGGALGRRSKTSIQRFRFGCAEHPSLAQSSVVIAVFEMVAAGSEQWKTIKN